MPPAHLSQAPLPHWACCSMAMLLLPPPRIMCSHATGCHALPGCQPVHGYRSCGRRVDPCRSTSVLRPSSVIAVVCSTSTREPPWYHPSLASHWSTAPPRCLPTRDSTSLSSVAAQSPACRFPFMCARERAGPMVALECRPFRAPSPAPLRPLSAATAATAPPLPPAAGRRCAWPRLCGPRQGLPWPHPYMSWSTTDHDRFSATVVPPFVLSLAIGRFPCRALPRSWPRTSLRPAKPPPRGTSS